MNKLSQKEKQQELERRKEVEIERKKQESQIKLEDWFKKQAVILEETEKINKRKEQELLIKEQKEQRNKQMKLECKIEELRNGILQTERITGKNLTLPVLNSILLTASKNRSVKVCSNCFLADFLEVRLVGFVLLVFISLYFFNG